MCGSLGQHINCFYMLRLMAVENLGPILWLLYHSHLNGTGLSKSNSF